MKMIFFLTFLISFATQAANLTYKTIEMSAAPVDQAMQFDGVFNKEGFYSLADTSHGIPSLGINQVYFKSEDQFVMLKYGIEGDVPLDEIITTPKGFMIHKKQNDQIYMMYFRGFNIEYVQVMLNRLNQKVSTFKAIQNFVIPTAHAEECGAFGKPILNQSSQLAGISAGAAWGMLKSCMTGVGSGVYDSTVGVVAGVGKELWAFVSHPIDYTEAVADKVQNFLTKTSQFVKLLVTNPEQAFANVGTGLGKAWDTIKTGVMSMSTEMKINFICSLIGALGVDAAIALLTAGTSSPKVALTLANIANKFGKLGKVFKLLAKFSSKTLAKIKLEGAKLEKFMKGIFSNKYPDGDLAHINQLAHASDEVSLRTLSCYIR